MDSRRANHFGNPLITASVGSKAPASPVGSTFSKNDIINSKTTKQQQSIDHLYLSFEQRGSMEAPSSLAYHRQAVSPNLSFSERDSHNESSLLGSTITTAGSTIGLPSHYPGSANHHRINSLESSVLLEELQDFDDIFEQGQASSSQNSLTHSQDDEPPNERESFIARVQSADYDDEDDLQSLSRSLPTRFSFQHRRNISDLSALSLSTPIPHVEPEKARRSNSVKNNSNHSSTSSTRSSPSNTTASTRHRRSRNRALSSTEFQNSVLEQL